ncbi:Arc family DNA-binding protein [Methylobacterium aquaticum]|uniref:Arc family DNA-binding protein n=1 Tax=Methylobacterium aquaticum TaxID=270351 RepID=UPI001933950B|nr:Arc family DNA-binding protein [Methylobacterium aquaticum]QRE76483.1 Arc family DNA-binding protein [Methylobacterium aquaticum]
MSDKAYSRTLDKIIVRLPDGMRDRLAAAAAANKRSVNAEVVALLDAALRDVGPKEADEFQEDMLAGIKNDLYFIKSHLISLHGQEDIAKIIPGEYLTNLDDYISRLPEPKPSRVDALRYIIKRGLDVVMGTRGSGRLRA